MKKIILLSLVFFTLLAGSCKKALDLDSTRVVNEKNYWNTLEDARAGIMGVYGLTRAALADNNGHWIYGDVRMGNFEAPVRQDLRAIVRNDLNAQYPLLDDLSNWRRFYAVINAANIFLERIPEVRAKDARYTANNMQVDIAQVRFLRAFAYFYMVRIWGDVPFITSSRDGSFENVGKSSKDAILEFVSAEMLAAALELPYQFSSGDIQQPGQYYGESSGRWNGALVRKLSAYGVLAQVCAWQGKYSEVLKYTNEVINNYTRAGMSYITTDVLTNNNGLFWDKKNEHLLGFGFIWGHQDASFTGVLEQLTLAAPVVNKAIPDIYVPKDSILSIFKEVGDARFNIDTSGITWSDRYFRNFGGRYPIFNKVKVILAAEQDKTFRLFSSTLVFTRLEDITLLRAEAYAVLGQNTQAIDDLNIIRRRRYNADQRGLLSNDLWIRYSVALHGPVIEAIFKERQKEFMGEGMHWYDKIRYEKIKQTNAPFLDMINTGKIYWPISRAVLAQNPLLTQNPAWK
ncbi:MAG: RagB/SusD family nutrient uptake outer membrane protein [Pedobacter sp.]|nr:MAG: RagB/SusD family nutrient uptake outer membrane protein [Pedobacter sp.]